MNYNNITPEEIYYTLHSKILNFIQGTNHRYAGQWEATQYIKQNFPSALCHSMNHEVMSWCERNFGNNWIWNWDTVYFKHEKDKVFFLLRWL